MSVNEAGEEGESVMVSRENLFKISAIVGLLFALWSVVWPYEAASTFGLYANNQWVNVVRMAAFLVAGLALLNWFAAAGSDKTSVWVNFFVAFFVTVGCVLSAMSGVLNLTTWVLAFVVGLLGLGFLMEAVKQ